MVPSFVQTCGNRRDKKIASSPSPSSSSSSSSSLSSTLSLQQHTNTIPRQTGDDIRMTYGWPFMRMTSQWPWLFGGHCTVLKCNWTKLFLFFIPSMVVRKFPNNYCCTTTCTSMKMIMYYYLTLAHIRHFLDWSCVFFLLWNWQVTVSKHEINLVVSVVSKANNVACGCLHKACELDYPKY